MIGKNSQFSDSNKDAKVSFWYRALSSQLYTYTHFFRIRGGGGVV